MLQYTHTLILSSFRTQKYTQLWTLTYTFFHSKCGSPYHLHFLSYTNTLTHKYSLSLSHSNPHHLTHYISFYLTRIVKNGFTQTRNVYFWSVVAAQLSWQLLSIANVRGSNPAIMDIIIVDCTKDENKEKESGNGPFWNKIFTSKVTKVKIWLQNVFEWDSFSFLYFLLFCCFNDLSTYLCTFSSANVNASFESTVLKRLIKIAIYRKKTFSLNILL